MRATKRQHEQALRIIRKHYGYGPKDEDGPKLIKDYEGWYSSHAYAIVWEDGPYEWAIRVSCGGFDEEMFHNLYPEFASEQEAIKKSWKAHLPMPAGTYSEAISSYSLGLYKSN